MHGRNILRSGWVPNLLSYFLNESRGDVLMRTVFGCASGVYAESTPCLALLVYISVLASAAYQMITPMLRGHDNYHNFIIFF